MKATSKPLRKRRVKRNAGCRLCGSTTYVRKDGDDDPRQLRRCSVCQGTVCLDCVKQVYQLDEGEVDERWRRKGWRRDDVGEPARPYRCGDCYLYSPKPKAQKPKA